VSNIIRNCHACIHLEWADGDIYDPDGFVCNKRQYKSDYEENRHLDKLEDEEYRSRYKSCWEASE
jgi:hypothetical protein